MKNNHDYFIDRMEDMNPEALYPTNMEEAIIGICDNNFEDQPFRFAVSYSKSIEILARDMQDDEDPIASAKEFFDYNVAGSWVGINGPIYVYDE